MITVEQAADLAAILEVRGDPMRACRESPWLRRFLKVPANASRPLAMSGPHPRAVGSYGAECLKWAKAEHDFTPRWWQALAITRQLEHDEDGALVWREVDESGPRRIGKSVRLRTTATWRICSDRFAELQMAMMVSKDLAAGKEIHRGAWRWAERKYGRGSVTRLNGAQEIETPDGDRWLLRAPDSVYSYDIGYGQVDEAWKVDPQAITDGLEPAMLERESPQLHLTSTGHVRATSLMRRRLVAALRDADPNVLLLLWGAAPGMAYGDPKTWKASSPYWTPERREMVERKYLAALAGESDPEMDDPDPVRGWAAQYLNVWPGLLGGGDALVMPKWADRATETQPDVPGALGLAMDLDRVWLSLASSTRADRRHLAAVLRVRADIGAAEVVEEAARVCKKHHVQLAVHAKGPTAPPSSVIEDLEGLGVQVRRASFDDYAGACKDVFDGVESGGVEHGEYPELDDAVAAAGGWQGQQRRVWARRNGDISMLEAATLADWCTNEDSIEPWGAWT